MVNWVAIERQLASIRPQTWPVIEQRLQNILPVVNETISLSQKDITLYPRNNEDGENLSKLLANLNHYVQRLGELHATTEALKIWTDKRYEAEKGLETVRIVKEEKKAVNYAQSAKYEKVHTYIDIMVEAARIDKRVQNARSSARDTTEAIRSRIGQLRGQLRSN